jgi:hypothetical protein
MIADFAFFSLISGREENAASRRELFRDRPAG